jgi:peptidoglycan/xylan/chitin deacetylase (PgdA/CDA1 family)
VIGSIVKVETDEPFVSFTFDDGPDPECTPAILDVLRGQRARATFFVLAGAASREDALVQQVLADGHEIGLHGWSHRAMTELSPSARAVSILRGRRELARAIGARPSWFRAPYGKQTVDVALLARILGMRSVMWSAFACEWEDHPNDWCVDHAVSAMTAGTIVLLHDGAAGERGRTRPVDDVVEIVTALLGAARDRGLHVVPVGTLVRHGRPQRRLWFHDWKL